jgi:hypothetical protein
MQLMNLNRKVQFGNKLPNYMYKIIFTIRFILLSFLSFAQNDQYTKLDKYVTAYAIVYDFQGVVLDAKDGKILYGNAFGHAI